MQKTRTILTIDNDPEILDAVEAFLNTREYKVVTAQRWTEAIAMLTEADPDAILLDLHLPTVQGEALLEFIRENHPELPVVIISSEATPTEMARLGELGANGFIRKPFDTEDLVVILEQVLIDLESDTPEPVPPQNAPQLPISEPETQIASIAQEDDEDDIEDDEEPVTLPKKRERPQLPGNITPGSGINNLTRMQPAPQQQPQQTIRRKRKKKKRLSGRKATRLRTIRNYTIIFLVFVGMGLLLYKLDQGFDTNFIGGITFGSQKTETTQP